MSSVVRVSADGLIDHVFACKDTRGCRCDPRNAVGGRPGPGGEPRQAEPGRDVSEDRDRFASIERIGSE